jgi:predicted nucleic acid-binding protein
MIVVDTNIIASLYLSSERSQQAELAFQKDFHWAAPLLWRSELRSVLAGYIRNERLNLTDAQQIMESAASLMRDHEYEVASHRVLSLVAGSTCSAYDCEFIALAEDLNTQLVTADQQILEQFPDLSISLDEFIV